MARRARAEVLRAAEAMVALQVRPMEISRQLAAKFDISERQAHRYVAKVYDALAKENEGQKPLRKHQLRQSLQAVFTKAMQSNQLSAAVAALDRLGKLDGLWAPLQVDHNVQGSVEMMTSDQQRKRLFELAAKSGVPFLEHGTRTQTPERPFVKAPTNGKGNGHDTESN